jgi:hypothetical protein
MGEYIFIEVILAAVFGLTGLLMMWHIEFEQKARDKQRIRRTPPCAEN